MTRQFAHGRIIALLEVNMPVILILREKEYEVNHGMTLRDTLNKIDVQPEAVLAVHQDQLITDEEILIDGAVIKLIAVISGG